MSLSFVCRGTVVLKDYDSNSKKKQIAVLLTTAGSEYKLLENPENIFDISPEFIELAMTQNPIQIRGELIQNSILLETWFEVKDK